MGIFDATLRATRSIFPTDRRLQVEEALTRRWATDVAGAGLDPYELHWVDPGLVVRISGRARPRQGGHAGCGRVEGGDWDLRPPDPGGDPIAKLVCESRFEDTSHFRSLAHHFIEGAPWADTELISVLRAQKGDPSWPAYKNLEAIDLTCRRLDSLFADVVNRGVRPNRELVLERRYGESFLFTMRHEILIDVARDGQMLFYEGRHRLSIAKLAGVSRIPVAIATRHQASLEGSHR